MIVCVFDTETTGLIENHTKKLKDQPEVIEFAAAWADWDRLDVLVDQYSVLIRPSKSLPDQVRLITKLSDADLASCPAFKDVHEQISKVLTGVEIVCAHNLSFDMEMIDIEYERLGRKVAWPPTKICTVEQTIHIDGNRTKLDDLYMLLTGQQHVGAHRAMADVLATLACLREIRARGWM
jgi:DNA polymerase III alpha subunit (gram-positive type)